MDAVEFFKTVKRLCKNQGCNGCPVCKNKTCMVMLIARLYGVSDESIEETISKVEQWSKDHPIKTRQSEFLKMFPKVPMKADAIDICPATVVKGFNNAEHCNHTLCEDCRKTFWLMEVSE